MSVRRVNIFTVGGGSVPPSPGNGGVNLLYTPTTNSLQAINPDGTTRAVNAESFVAWTPSLTGATNAPAPTYSTRVGRYHKVGKMVHFTMQCVTTTMTKSTLTDELRITLPFKCANVTGGVYNCAGRVGNATAVVNAGLVQIAPNTQYMTFRTAPLSGGTSVAMTYALASLGTLTNTITFQASGCYESVS